MEKKIENKKSTTIFREEAILAFWKEKNVFQKTLEKESPKGEFIFYEGPPTANGKPGIHHLEARAFKDAIPRYKTMQGFHVRRKAGWDTHGLPVELQVEKELGLNSKKGIEEYGIEKFNEKCRESVLEYLDIWEKFTSRIGYWVDQKNSYFTYRTPYIESVWNIIKVIQEQKLLYKDYKVVPWCPRCGTALSSHELAQGYQNDKDQSLYVKFKVLGEDTTYLVAWTTTPWTLPGNVALAVGSDLDYIKITIDSSKRSILKQDYNTDISEGTYIFSKETIVKAGIFQNILIVDNPDKYRHWESKTDSFSDKDFWATKKIVKGSELIGLSYEPLYPFLENSLRESERGKIPLAFKVYPADFIKNEEGTGIVHTAVMYGIDDFELGTKLGLPKQHLVAPDGTFIQCTGFLEGRFVKDEAVTIDLIKDLNSRELLFKKEKYEHSYPHCWRCKTALIYYARDSWYIRMSAPEIKDSLLKENQKINWEPEYIRDGRFGEWLNEVKDWAISRERYWGTPLPIWATQNGKIEVIGSINELKAKIKKSGNKYFVMRHGGTQSNEDGIVSFKNQLNDPLIKKGKIEVEKTTKILKEKKIDLIISSPFLRTQQTAEIVAKNLNLPSEQIIADVRLQEIEPGDFDGKAWEQYHHYIYGTNLDWFIHKIPNGESYKDVQKRITTVLYELEEKYQNKNILIITHGGPAWLFFINANIYDFNSDEYQSVNNITNTIEHLKNAEVRELFFAPLPHNKDYEVDLHRPYIDDIKLISEEGEEMTRVKEVLDVWFDSGAMPFAQDHYPFENKEWIETKGYPADFICEAIDQTRGWFYTLHAVGILMRRSRAYNNVICLGHILDNEGKKMSKSLGNIVDPWLMIEKYGADTLRLWMYSINQPGESKNFDEKTIAELHNKVFNLLYNILSFYELYRDLSVESDEYKLSSSVLDQWIISRLMQLINHSTENIEQYRLLEPVRAMRDFIDDFSTWYVRRSRDRLKNGDKEAKQTFYYVLKNLAKLLAPFAPFAAEDIWQKLKTTNEKESIHLEAWPTALNIGDSNVIEHMKELRLIVTAALEARQKAGIKVRQPLQSLILKQYSLGAEYTEILKEELNVKEIIVRPEIESNFILDTILTPELTREGEYRELLRAIQDLRKKSNLTPDDVITLVLSENAKEIVERFSDEMKKIVIAKEILYKENRGEIVQINSMNISAQIVR